MHKSLAFEYSLARRFLEENKGQTLLIILGITVGVAVMVFLTALIDGLQADLISKMIGKSPHMVISSVEATSQEAAKKTNGLQLLLLDTTQKDQLPIVEWRTLESALRADPRNKTVLPVVDGSGLIRRGDVTRGVILRGFELEQANRIYNISSSIIDGNPQPLNGSILIGKDLAADLGIRAGDPILLELAGQNPLSLMVDGVFDLGISAINQQWLLMDQQQLGALLGIGDRVTSMEIQVYDIFRADLLAREWERRLPGYRVESWQESNAQILSALKSQSSSSYTIQFFVLLAVTIGVASVLAINAVQKSKQIGILKAMGIRTASVARVFMIQGMALGFIGSILGFLLGVLLSKVFILLNGQQFKLLLNPIPLAIILFSTMLAATLSAYLPARSVSRLNPIEVIRNG